MNRRARCISGRWTRAALGRPARRQLRERYESLDPFALKLELERRLGPILTGAAESAGRPARGD